MVKQSPPTARARYLGKVMKGLREARKYTATEVADFLGKTQPTISRYEAGEYPIPGDDFLKLLDMYGVDDEIERASLIQLNLEAPNRGWVDTFKPYIKNLANHVWMEEEADEVRLFELAVAPGMVQTRGYAEALISNGPQRDDAVTVQRQVEARLMRGQLLAKPGGPIIKMLLDETVLRRHVGGPEVMKGQLGKLLQVAELEKVELRLLPATSSAHIAAGIAVGFTLFLMPRPLPDMVYIDASAAAIYEEDPHIDLFKNTYDALWAGVALSPEASTERIETELKDVTK